MELSQSLTAINIIPIVLSDEFGNIITFSRNTLINQATAITVDQQTFSETNLNAIAPFTLNLDPKLLELNGKIYKIDYDFGDGNTFSQKYFYSSKTNNLLNYPNDIGDPRNYTISNTYYLTDNIAKYVQVSVKIYELGNTTPSDYFVNLNLNTPNLDGEVDGYFKNIHLISTKMFGPDDKILYVFESDEPNYILPAIVKWGEDPKIIQSRIVVDKLPRLFNVLLPFEDEFYNANSNLNINSVDGLKPPTKLIDTGNINAKPIKV
jgi:hypothetical protein